MDVLKQYVFLSNSASFYPILMLVPYFFSIFSEIFEFIKKKNIFLMFDDFWTIWN